MCVHQHTPHTRTKVADEMERIGGWKMEQNTTPQGLHFTILPPHCAVQGKLIADMQAAIALVKADPVKYASQGSVRLLFSFPSSSSASSSPCSLNFGSRIRLTSFSAGRRNEQLLGLSAWALCLCSLLVLSARALCLCSLLGLSACALSAFYILLWLLRNAAVRMLHGHSGRRAPAPAQN